MNTHQSLAKRYADRMAIPIDLLQHHLDQLPPHQQMHSDQLLYLADKYQLDLLTGEVALTDYDDGHTQVHISVDGWTQLIHRHEQFCGLQFQEATTLDEGVPEWMMCTIYRKDLLLPIVVKEYYKEIRTTERIWQTMPRRMLRHRALQQCARLAFGFSGAELLCPNLLKISTSEDCATQERPVKPSRTQVLKTSLQHQTTTQSEADKLLTPTNSTTGMDTLGPVPSGS